MSHKIELNLEKATEIYNALLQAGCRFPLTSWSPERHQEAIEKGRQSPEFITVMDPSPEQRELLKGFDFKGASDNSWPGLCVQKHGAWPRDIYEAASESEKMEMDLAWLDHGGHLSEERMDQLAEAGKIRKNWR